MTDDIYMWYLLFSRLDQVQRGPVWVLIGFLTGGIALLVYLNPYWLYMKYGQLAKARRSLRAKKAT